MHSSRGYETGGPARDESGRVASLTATAWGWRQVLWQASAAMRRGRDRPTRRAVMGCADAAAGRAMLGKISGRPEQAASARGPTGRRSTAARPRRVVKGGR